MKNLIIIPLVLFMCSCTINSITAHGNINTNIIEDTTLSSIWIETEINTPNIINASGILIDGILPPLSPTINWQYKGLVEETFYIYDYLHPITVSGGLFISDRISKDNYYETKIMQNKGWYSIGGAMRGGASEGFYYNWEINRYLILSDIWDYDKNLSYQTLWLSINPINIPTPIKTPIFGETNQ